MGEIIRTTTERGEKVLFKTEVENTSEEQRCTGAFHSQFAYLRFIDLLNKLEANFYVKQHLRLTLDPSRTFKCAFNETLNGTSTGNWPKYLR